MAATDPLRVRIESLTWTAKRWVRSQAAVWAAGLLCLLFVASDFVVTTNRFWSGHQVVTSILTNAALAFVAISGLNRLVAIREAKRWRPLGLLITDRLGFWVGGLEDTLQVHVLAYCERHFGDCEIPEGRDYFGVLMEAFRDPLTWEDDGGEIPGLIRALNEQVEKAESDLETWAPILLADPRLTEIGTAAISIHELTKRIRNALETLSACVVTEALSTYERNLLRPIRIVEALLIYRFEVENFRRLAEDFRGPGARPGRPLVPDEVFEDWLTDNGYAAWVDDYRSRRSVFDFGS